MDFTVKSLSLFDKMFVDEVNDMKSELRVAQANNYYVAIRGEDVNGYVEPYGQGIYILTEDQLHQYLDAGGTWTYCRPHEIAGWEGHKNAE